MRAGPVRLSRVPTLGWEDAGVCWTKSLQGFSSCVELVSVQQVQKQLDESLLGVFIWISHYLPSTPGLGLNRRKLHFFLMRCTLWDKRDPSLAQTSESLDLNSTRSNNQLDFVLGDM